MAWPTANMKSSLFSLSRVEAEGSFLEGLSRERLPWARSGLVSSFARLQSKQEETSACDAE